MVQSWAAGIVSALIQWSVIPYWGVIHRLSSQKALLLYSAKPNWGGWGDFTALPALSAGSLRGENRPQHLWGLSTGLKFTHMYSTMSEFRDIHGGKVAVGRCRNFDWLAFVVCSAENTWGHTVWEYAWCMQTLSHTHSHAHTCTHLFFKA